MAGAEVQMKRELHSTDKQTEESSSNDSDVSSSESNSSSSSSSSSEENRISKKEKKRSKDIVKGEKSRDVKDKLKDQNSNNQIYIKREKNADDNEHRKKRRREESLTSDEEQNLSDKEQRKEKRDRKFYEKNFQKEIENKHGYSRKSPDESLRYREKQRKDQDGNRNYHHKDRRDEERHKGRYEAKGREKGDEHRVSRQAEDESSYKRNDFNETRSRKNKIEERQRDRYAANERERSDDYHMSRKNNDESRNKKHDVGEYNDNNREHRREKGQRRDERRPHQRESNKERRGMDDNEDRPKGHVREWDKGKPKHGYQETEPEQRERSDSNEAREGGNEQKKEEPNFELSGKLTEFTNTYKGVVIKYNEPPEARKPKTKWRLYPFKGDESLPILYIHRQSAFLLGRNRMIADIPVDHPSCSSQHAVIQFRFVDYEKPDGSMGKRVKPYIIDLESSNGTFVNNNKIEARRYVELKEKDVIKFGFSSREYVVLHDQSKGEFPGDEE